jgi:hypothetical protein
MTRKMKRKRLKFRRNSGNSSETWRLISNLSHLSSQEFSSKSQPLSQFSGILM